VPQQAVKIQQETRKLKILIDLFMLLLMMMIMIMMAVIMMMMMMMMMYRPAQSNSQRGE